MDTSKIDIGRIDNAIGGLQFLRDVKLSKGDKDTKTILQYAIDELIVCADTFGSMMTKDTEKENNVKSGSDMVNEPPHYMQHAMECIDEMVEVFGVDAVIHYCMCNVWKYRYRAPFKSNAEEDNMKSDWYMHAIHDLKEYGRVHSFKIVKNGSEKSSDDI